MRCGDINNIYAFILKELSVRTECQFNPVCLSENLLVSGGEDWKVITWKLEEGELIKVFSSHSAAVLELKLEQIIDADRSYARKGLLLG